MEAAGFTVTDDDLINRDIVDAQTLVGNGWSSCDPWAGPIEAISIFTAVVVRLTGRSLSDVAAQLAELPAHSIMPRKRPMGDDSPSERDAAAAATS